MKRFTLSGFLNFFSSKDLAFYNSGESSFKLNLSKNSSNEENYSNNWSGSSSSIIRIKSILLIHKKCLLGLGIKMAEQKIALIILCSFSNFKPFTFKN
jgi:hypothetical protein